jgi:hypothetical protein
MKKVFAVLAVMLLLFIMACSNDNNNYVDNGTGETSGTSDSNGGTIEVTNPLSPIKGTKVVIPTGAILNKNKQVKITISYSDELPSPAPLGTVVASKVIILKKDFEGKFQNPISVTIPYTDVGLDAGDIPVVYYWDLYAKKYSAVGTKSIDTTNKTITFTTVHFTNYVALGIKGLATLLDSISGNDIVPSIGFGLHPRSETKYVRVVGRNQSPIEWEKGSCHEAPKEFCC